MLAALLSGSIETPSSVIYCVGRANTGDLGILNVLSVLDLCLWLQATASKRQPRQSLLGVLAFNVVQLPPTNNVRVLEHAPVG
jgi:hypothetical protein